MKQLKYQKPQIKIRKIKINTFFQRNRISDSYNYMDFVTGVDLIAASSCASCRDPC